MSATNDAKRRLRGVMRSVRVPPSQDPALSASLCERLWSLGWSGGSDGAVMVFRPVAGEPDIASFVDRCRVAGTTVVAAAPDPSAPHPARPGDVSAVIVPGLAFTCEGDRLGQGGGWYDRFLSGVMPSCRVIGVCFDEQVVAEVPVDVHDRPVGRVITPTRTIVVGRRRDPGGSPVTDSS